MIISSQQPEHEIFGKIHAVVEGNTGNIFLGDSHIMVDRRTFERIVFTMQTALMEYDLLEQSKNGEY